MGEDKIMGNINNDCMAFLKGVGYVAYNLGLSIPVGLLRIAVSATFIAKHAIYAKAYDEAANAEQKKIDDTASARTDKVVTGDVKRTQENRTAAKKGWWRGKATQVKNAVAGGVHHGVAAVKEVGDDIDRAEVKIQAAVIKAKEETQMEMWKSELWRGLRELIPIIGSGYNTLQDYGKIKASREWRDVGGKIFGFDLKPGYWGLNRPAELIRFESQLNGSVWT